MPPLGFCFLGCGARSARHLRTLRRLRPGARVAVASRSLERARAFASEHGVSEHFASYDGALCSAFEVLVIATPPRGHHALLAEAVARGKHVLVEKPVVASLAELDALWPALLASRAAVFVAENDHFAPFHRKLKARLAAGVLGRPLFLDLARVGVTPPRGFRADPEEMPLGALHEGGVHWIRRLLDLASVFDEGADAGVLDVAAYGPNEPLGPTPREDTTMLVTRHRSGLTSRLLHSWALPRRFFPFEVSKFVLSEGALTFDARGAFAVEYRGRRRHLLGPALRDRGGFQAMWTNFLGCIERGLAPELTLAQVRADFAVLDAALRAKNTGMALPPTRPPGEVV